mgnify:CR=1 FL=1
MGNHPLAEHEKMARAEKEFGVLTVAFQIIKLLRPFSCEDRHAIEYKVKEILQ